MRISLVSTFVALTALTGLCALSVPAHSQVLFDPTNASTTIPLFASNTSVTNIINQSGLSTPYISGVTTLASYTATHDDSSGNNDWISQQGVTTGNIDFDMGTPLTLSSFLLWNVANAEGIGGFTLIGSSDPTFSSSATHLGSFTTHTTGSVGAVNEEVFSFVPTTDRYFRMEITSNKGNVSTLIGEVAFAGTVAAPEPGALALLALGGLPLVGAVVRRRHSAGR